MLPVELLHGITFASGWGAGTTHSRHIAPPGLAATMQGIFQGLYFGARLAKALAELPDSVAACLAARLRLVKAAFEHQMAWPCCRRASWGLCFGVQPAVVV